MRVREPYQWQVAWCQVINNRHCDCWRIRRAAEVEQQQIIIRMKVWHDIASLLGGSFAPAIKIGGNAKLPSDDQAAGCALITSRRA